MSKKSFLMIVLVFAIACVGMVSCAHTPKPSGEDVADDLAGAPDWVVKGCHAYWSEQAQAKGKVCGVGSVGGTRSSILARSGAIARARGEISKAIEGNYRTAMHVHIDCDTSGAGVACYSQDLLAAAKQVALLSLGELKPADSWVSPGGTFYELLILDVETFKSNVPRAENLSDAVREALLQLAGALFSSAESE